MSVEEKYKENNIKVQQLVRIEIEKVKMGISNKSIVQLESILKELEKTLKRNNLPLSYPRYIVDSWDFQDKLGIELLNLAELYERWK